MPGERVASSDEAEWKTRKKRIDPRLDTLDWKKLKPDTAALHPHRTEEEETDNGPADYGLWLNSDLVGIVEAKKVTVGPQNVLTQAARYSRGARNTKFDHDGHMVPFLYSTNVEVFWFHDVRHRPHRPHLQRQDPRGAQEVHRRARGVVRPLTGRPRVGAISS